MRPDPNKLFTKTITAVNGPQKQFNTKEGPKEKYQVVFDDGYEGEYCPLVGKFDAKVKQGASFPWRVAYRSGSHADEIEPAQVQQFADKDTGEMKTRLSNMHSHPAVISLNAAMRYHAEVKKESAVQLSDILADAETVLDWLDKQVNIDSL